MIIDYNLLFTGGTTGVGNSDNATDSPTTGTQNSSQVVDLAGPGLPASATTPNNLPGRDIGIGDTPALKVVVTVTTAFGGGTNIAVGLAGAPDNGSGSPGSYTTYFTGPTVAEAQLIVGARLYDMDVPRLTQPSATNNIVGPPRYLRLAYTNSGTHTSGKLEGFIALDRFDQIMNSNAVLSGYPAGVTVAN